MTRDNKPLARGAVQLVQLNQRQFNEFREYAYKVSGIRVNDNKLSLLSNRIRRRLKAGHFTDFDAYYSHLTGPSGQEELERFLDAITTNETSFFRTDSHFKWFTDEFLRDLIKEVREGQRMRSMRIWSAGCATGAEPYSIAICLWENRHRLSDWSLSIFGTDISEEALSAARAGVFDARSVEGVSERRLRHCFEPSGHEGGIWQVRPHLKEHVRFERHNLMMPIRQAPFDCIFIRNVLIYFDRDSKRTVVDNLINALKPGGFLVVGPSEGIFDMLEPLERRDSLLYYKPAKRLQ